MVTLPRSPPAPVTLGVRTHRKAVMKSRKDPFPPSCSMAFPKQRGKDSPLERPLVEVLFTLGARTLNRSRLEPKMVSLAFLQSFLSAGLWARGLPPLPACQSAPPTCAGARSGICKTRQRLGWISGDNPEKRIVRNDAGATAPQERAERTSGRPCGAKVRCLGWLSGPSYCTTEH